MATVKDKMKNVAFGGNWSEDLVARNDQEVALDVLEHAVENCMEEKPSGPELEAALAYIVAAFPKGKALTARLSKCFAIPHPELRQKEAQEALRLIRRWCV